MVGDKPTLQKMLELYKEGRSDVQIMSELNITKKDFAELYEKNQAFKRVVDQGRVYCEAWWTEKGQTALADRGFNSTVWSLVMKNRFGWSEKSEVLGDKKPEDKSTEELQRELQEHFKKATQDTALN